MKTTHYLRVEGVNLAHFVEDTADLSTIRGGGLLLLAAVARIEDCVKRLAGVEALVRISSGASSGLFELQLKEGAEPGPVRDQLTTDFLRADGTLSQATFVADIVPNSGDFARDREQLVALNRHRQMTSPSFAAPAWNQDAQVEPCDFDHLRPGTDRADRPPRNPREPRHEAPASPSARIRRDFGRKQRRKFYERLVAGEYEPPEETPFDAFTQELGELAGAPPTGVPDLLADKIAVLYWDGNKFGKLQREHCRTEERQRAFDEQVQALRRKLLVALLTEIDRAPKAAGWWSAGGNRRLETLLWGGDELIWVAPAWQGWRVLTLFYECTRDWAVKLPDGEGNDDEHRLTHAGGLVFAHHNAPIHRLTHLAKALANGVKDRLVAAQTAPADPAANRFDYEVLESFDHVGPSLEAYRARRLPPQPDGRRPDVSLEGRQAGALAEAMRELAAPPTGNEALPRRQLHLAYKKWQDGGWTEATLAKAIQDNPNLALHQARFGNVAKATEPLTLWYHLSNLWDYVARVPAA